MESAIQFQISPRIQEPLTRTESLDRRFDRSSSQSALSPFSAPWCGRCPRHATTCPVSAQLRHHRLCRPFGRFDRHRVDVRPAGGFRDGFGVVAVVLAAFDEGLHISRRDRPQPVAQRLQRAGPMEPTRARVGFRRKPGPSDSGMPCSVNTALDVSIATRLYAVMDGSCLGVLTTPSLARDAVGPSTPTSPRAGSAGVALGLPRWMPLRRRPVPGSLVWSQQFIQCC
jgi:hypothetical protein